MPPQVETKLDYLLCLIEGHQVPPPLALPELEKNSLDEVSAESRVNLFCSIVNCLSGKDEVLYFKNEQGYIRKCTLFSMWKGIYITCDSNSISIRKKPDHQPRETIAIAHLLVGKFVYAFKRKHVFKIQCNQQQEYIIGFDLESACHKVHSLLRKLTSSKRKRPDKKN
jgi:hypothetical protein